MMESAMDTKERVAEIRRLNEQFRTTFRGGQILLSASVAELPDMVRASALEKIATYNDFNQENDPHQERDYGSFRPLRPGILLQNRLLLFGIGDGFPRSG
jgi:hypothetical protein